MQALSKTISIKVHARLHMGFYDLTHNLTRTQKNFGSIGLALENPVTEMVASAADKLEIFGDVDAKSRENIIKIAQNLQKSINLQTSLSLRIGSIIPSHVGLGSGTQLVLSLVSLFNQVYNLNLTQAQIAQLSGRGARSGIGLGAFEQGGFLVDAGKQADALPEIAIRHDFPQGWRIILVSDSAQLGMHGVHELNAFKALKPMQSDLKTMVLEDMAPALQRADLLAFGAYMDDLQAYNGAYFSPVQGGLYASNNVESALNYLKQNGVACVGQSSWGPTGFAIVGNAEKANLYLEALKKEFAANANLSFALTQGYNQGATIKAE